MAQVRGRLSWQVPGASLGQLGARNVGSWRRGTDTANDLGQWRTVPASADGKHHGVGLDQAAQALGKLE
jgi:hypothetical protein